MEFTGEFETHITVCLNDSDRIERLQKWSINHGLKCLHIVLNRGVTPSQLMLTRRHSWGNFTDELRTAYNNICQSLNAEGFSVTRIKIEAAPWNQGVPQSNVEMLHHSSDRYFENHIKLLLEPSAKILNLAEIAERHSAHLSRNVLRIRSDDRQEQFITQRCINVGRVEARQQFQALLDEITSLGYPFIEVEEEFVVYDSNLEIDAGWIQSQE